MATAPSTFRTQLERVRSGSSERMTPQSLAQFNDKNNALINDRGMPAYDMSGRPLFGSANNIVTGWQPSSMGGGGAGGGRRSSTISGYSAQNQGTGADKIRQWGGLSAPRRSLLNELYRNQPGRTMGAWDRLQSQQKMDMADPNAAFYADEMAVASGAGNWEKAAFMQEMLQNHLAMQQANGGGATATGTGGVGGGAAGGGGGAPGGPAYFRPGEERFDSAGNLWRWNQQLGRGEMIAPGVTLADVKAENEIGLWEPDAAFIGDGTLHTPYGRATVTQSDVPTTFDNGHGSRLGGVNFTGPNTGRQSAAEFFQNAADFGRRENAYAVPSPGYNGRAAAGFGEMGNPANAKAWQSYNSAMDKKKKLKA